jgi:hypothetical protein
VDLHTPGAKEACRVSPWNQESVGVEPFCVQEWQTFKGRFTPLRRSLNLQIISAASQRFDPLPELIETNRTAAPLYAPGVSNGTAPRPRARFGTAGGLHVPVRIERAVVLVRTWHHILNGCRRYGCACQLAGHAYAECMRYFRRSLNGYCLVPSFTMLRVYVLLSQVRKFRYSQSSFACVANGLGHGASDMDPSPFRCWGSRCGRTPGAAGRFGDSRGRPGRFVPWDAMTQAA